MLFAAKIDETTAGLSVTLAGDRQLTFDREALPEPFLRWQSASRLRMFEALEANGAGSALSHAAHLPVLATLGDGPFPINLACKGMGPLPCPEHIDRFADLFERTRQDLANAPWPETLPRRLEAARALYSDPCLFDPFALAGLEIFEGETARNLEQNPLASLLFTGEAPRYPSYQLSGVVQRVGSGDARYRFLVAARQLFAHDAFHLPQSRYPFGFVFNVVAWKDKTPFSRGP